MFDQIKTLKSNTEMVYVIERERESMLNAFQTFKDELDKRIAEIAS